MKRKQIQCWLAGLGTVALIFSGCSTTFGEKQIKSHFVFPNSNVENLGPTSAEKSKTGFFSIPMFKLEDVKGVRDDAISKVNGANILVDYKEDTTVTSYPFFVTVTYRLEGTAAKMTVGKKELK